MSLYLHLRERESYEAIVEELLHIIPMLKHVGPSPIFGSHLKGKHLGKKKSTKKTRSPGIHSFYQLNIQKGALNVRGVHPCR